MHSWLSRAKARDISYAGRCSQLETKKMSSTEIEEIIKSRFPVLNKDSIIAISKFSSFLNFKKGEKLIYEGKKHHSFYLILKGSVKAYYTKETKEVCSWFAFENEVIATIKTFNGLVSNETIVLLEDSKLIQFNTESIKELAVTNLDVSHLLIDILTEHTVFLEDKLYQLQFMSSEERYKGVVNAIPEILQKVSLTDLASFLGISRENLSRIRGKR